MSATKRGPSTPAQRNAVLKRVRGLCLAYPDVIESAAGMLSTFRVGKEAFAAVENDEGVLSLALRLGKGEASASPSGTLSLERHAARDGWTKIPLKSHVNWDEIRDLLLVAYVGVAPKRMLQQLEKRLTTSH